MYVQDILDKRERSPWRRTGKLKGGERGEGRGERGEGRGERGGPRNWWRRQTHRPLSSHCSFTSRSHYFQLFVTVFHLIVSFIFIVFVFLVQSPLQSQFFH